MLRLFGIPESEIARTLRAISESGVDLSPLEITTCLRRGEIEISTVYAPGAAPVYAQFVEEVEREQPRRARGSDDVVGIHDKSGLEASGRPTRRSWAHRERIDPIGRA